MSEDSEYNSLDGLIGSYFSNDSVIPSPIDSYYGESGAIKCISEDYGQIAFVSENFIDEHCVDDSGSNSDWCMGTDSYTSIGELSE